MNKQFTCPNCNQHVEAPEEIAGQSAECPSCAKSIKVPSEETAQELKLKKQPAAETPSSSNMIFCQNCGEKITRGVHFCPECEASQGNITPDGNSFGYAKILGITAVVFVLAAVTAFGILYGWQKYTSSSEISTEIDEIESAIEDAESAKAEARWQKVIEIVEEQIPVTGEVEQDHPELVQRLKTLSEEYEEHIQQEDLRSGQISELENRTKDALSEGKLETALKLIDELEKKNAEASLINELQSEFDSVSQRKVMEIRKRSKYQLEDFKNMPVSKGGFDLKTEELASNAEKHWKLAEEAQENHDWYKAWLTYKRVIENIHEIKRHITAETTPEDAVVFVETTMPGGKRRGSGSGFIARMEDGIYLITNQHVISGSAGTSFTTVSGEEINPISYEVVPDRDLIRLKLEPGDQNISVFNLCYDSPSYGESIRALGDSQSRGIIRSLEGQVKGYGSDKVEISAEIVRGNSGGPIINEEELVIGVSTEVHRPAPPNDWVTTGTFAEKPRRFGARLAGAEWEERPFMNQSRKLADIYTFMRILFEIDFPEPNAYTHPDKKARRDFFRNKWYRIQEELLDEFIGSGIGDAESFAKEIAGMEALFAEMAKALNKVQQDLHQAQWCTEFLEEEAEILYKYTNLGQNYYAHKKADFEQWTRRKAITNVQHLRRELRMINNNIRRAKNAKVQALARVGHLDPIQPIRQRYDRKISNYRRRANRIRNQINTLQNKYINN